MIATLRTWFRLLGRPVPFLVVEVEICLHEVVDREVVLAIEEPGAPPDDLLELNPIPIGILARNNLNRLNGGGGSLLRTTLQGKFPLTGKNTGNCHGLC
jgi:hypothetical protein